MKTKITLLLIAFSIIIGRNAHGQCALDQNQPLNDGGTSERNLPGYFDWQSFTAGMSGGLCEVDVLYCNTTTLLVGTGTLNIYSGTGIGGLLLTSQAVNVNGSATAQNLPFWQAFTITTPPNVIAGQVYTWEFIPTVAGGLTDPYLIQVNIPDVYAGGVSYNFGTGGDIAFATYVDGTTGMNNFQIENDFAVYPNPANDFVTVKLNSNATNETYIFTNELGQIVLCGKISEGNSVIDISELARGIYFLKVGEENRKVIKN